MGPVGVGWGGACGVGPAGWGPGGVEWGPWGVVRWGPWGGVGWGCEACGGGEPEDLKQREEENPETSNTRTSPEGLKT